MARRFQESVISNFIWFGVSLTIAVVVWIVATLQADPIGQRQFNGVDIQIELDEGMIITNNPSLNARVIVRAQQTVLNLLTEEDIVIYADLRGKGSGTHTVPLTIELARPGSTDSQPAQITVSLQQIVAQQKPVVVAPIELTANFAYSNLVQDVVQAEVSGAVDDVNEVVELRAELDLRDQRSNAIIERSLTLVAIDADGNRVQGVTISPRTALVTLELFQRDDVRIVTVRPSIQFDTLPENFEFRNVDYEPRTVIINGPPEALAQLGDTVDTLPISLAERTSNFTVEVPLSLPEDAGLLVLSSAGTISVQVEISEQTMSVPFENVPVTVIGVASGLSARTNPEQISVVLNGAVSLVQQIKPSDVQAFVDVNGLTAGTYELVPQITLLQGQITVLPENLTLLPSSVDIVLTAIQPEATPELQSTIEANQN
jgi:YbbR domain-containing protein